MALASWAKLCVRAAAKIRPGRGHRCSPCPSMRSTWIANHVRAIKTPTSSATRRTSAPKFQSEAHRSRAGQQRRPRHRSRPSNRQVETLPSHYGRRMRPRHVDGSLLAYRASLIEAVGRCPDGALSPAAQPTGLPHPSSDVVSREERRRSHAPESSPLPCRSS